MTTHLPDLSAARDLIGRRLQTLNVKPYRLATLADVDEQAVRRFLAGGGITADTLLRLLTAVGMAVTASPVGGYVPPPPTPVGRPKITGKIPAT